VTLGERIKKVRKYLDLTQQMFCVRIGFKRNSLSLIESGKRNISDQAILAICREYDVSESWLRTGEGEMFLPKAENALDALAKEHDMTIEERILIEKFLSLKPESRQAVIDYVMDVATSLNACREQAATIHQSAESDEERKQREWLEKVEREREEAHRMVDEEFDAKEKAEKVKRLLASELTGDASGMTG